MASPEVADLLQSTAESIIEYLPNDFVDSYRPSISPTTPPLAAQSDTDTSPSQLYQSQVADGFIRSPGNEIVFLPTGLDIFSVIDKSIADSLDKHPSKHVIIVVIRPAQALSFADRVRRRLHVAVGAYCGGDFLYNFPREFESNKVLIFTAGLLMHLTKLGIYKLDRASLLVLHDAFSTVRNHPMNTLVREYYWKLDSGAQPGSGIPRILCVVLPQLQNLQRPFDKLRQLLRKLNSSAQSGILLPTGPALEQLASRLHQAHLALHGYELYQEERELLEALQAHCILVWDVLHPYSQNHFGRLIHFPPLPQSTTGSTSKNNPASDDSSSKYALKSSVGHSMNAHGASARGSPGSHSPSQYNTAAATAVEEAHAATSFAFDPFHHDWNQIELMVKSSIECSLGLPENNGDSDVATSTSSNTTTTTTTGTETPAKKQQQLHVKSAAAIAVMTHVLKCCKAIKRGMELGISPCLATLVDAFQQLNRYLQEERGNAPDLDKQLIARIEEVIPTSPLLAWISVYTNGGMKGDTSIDNASAGNDENAVAETDTKKPLLIEEISPSSRMLALIDVLFSIQEHASTRHPVLFHTNNNGDNAAKRKHSVLIVCDDHISAMAVVNEISSMEDDLDADVRRWVISDGSAMTTTTTMETAKTDGEVENKGGETPSTKEISPDAEDSCPQRSLSISIMTVSEALSTAGKACITSAQEAVWFSAADVMFAAGFDFESPALSLFSRMCAVGTPPSPSLAAHDSQEKKNLRYQPGPQCHIIATRAQAAAWMEIRRADQLLLAAMQLVQAGDASFEEYFAQLASGSKGISDTLLVPPPASILHTMCLGLCGQPPEFIKASMPGTHGAMSRLYSATAVLPDRMIVPGHIFGLRQASYKGDAADSESEARDSAAEIALFALLSSGLVAAYWQTRQLLVQSQQIAIAMRASMHTHAQRGYQNAMPHTHGHQKSHHYGSNAHNTNTYSNATDDVSTDANAQASMSLRPSPFDGTLNSSMPVHGASLGHQHHPNESISHHSDANTAAVTTNERLICKICGIVTTSEAHLKEHEIGRRHIKNIERLQQGLAAVKGGGPTLGGMPPTEFLLSGPFASVPISASDKNAMERKISLSDADDIESAAHKNTERASRFNPDNLSISTLSTIDRLPSTLSDIFHRRSSSLHRHSSGNVYENFPCVRVGDTVLPSSMDLTAFLAEMQTLDELEGEGTLGLGNLNLNADVGSGLGGGGGAHQYSHVESMLPPVDEKYAVGESINEEMNSSSPLIDSSTANGTAISTTTISTTTTSTNTSTPAPGNGGTKTQQPSMHRAHNTGQYPHASSRGRSHHQNHQYNQHANHNYQQHHQTHGTSKGRGNSQARGPRSGISNAMYTNNNNGPHPRAASHQATSSSTSTSYRDRFNYPRSPSSSHENLLHQHQHAQHAYPASHHMVIGHTHQPNYTQHQWDALTSNDTAAAAINSMGTSSAPLSTHQYASAPTYLPFTMQPALMQQIYIPTAHPSYPHHHPHPQQQQQQQQQLHYNYGHHSPIAQQTLLASSPQHIGSNIVFIHNGHHPHHPASPQVWMPPPSPP